MIKIHGIVVSASRVQPKPKTLFIQESSLDISCFQLRSVGHATMNTKCK